MVGGCTTNCCVLSDIVLLRISDWSCIKVYELCSVVVTLD